MWLVVEVNVKFAGKNAEINEIEALRLRTIDSIVYMKEGGGSRFWKFCQFSYTLCYNKFRWKERSTFYLPLCSFRFKVLKLQHESI